MKYTFKCPKCGGTNLVLMEDVLTLTDVTRFSRSEHGVDVLAYGASEQIEANKLHGYFCSACEYKWPGIDEIDEDGGFVPVEKEDA